MQARRSGRIIAIASRTAVEPQALLGAYGSSKAALVALMHTLALELKSHNVTVNVVLPGTMDTPANRAAMPSADPGTWVHPAQVAKVILWLASEDAGQMTGANIPVYGTG
jgi:NAD(P)-dependent dehydrogenase (short-subunit alcohol dehydrogenase family)